MAKPVYAECKKCQSELIIDTEQEAAFCPYCGTKIVQSKKAVSLKMPTFKNLFHGPKEKDHGAGAVVPNDVDAEVQTCTCYLCSGSTLVDASNEDGFCKNCGGQIRRNGKMITSAPEPEKNKSFFPIELFKKYKIYMMIAVCALLGVVGFMIYRSNGASASETRHGEISEVIQVQDETWAETPTAKPTEKPTEAPTEAPTAAPTQKPTEEKTVPIDVPDGFTVLQAFFCNCHADSKIEELEALAQECGLYTYQFSYVSDFLELEISAEPYSGQTDNSEMYEFPGDYMHISFDTYTGSTRFHRLNYHFKANNTDPLRIEYDVTRWEDGSVIHHLSTYDIRNGETKLDTYSDPEPAMSAAIDIATGN